MKEIAIVLGLGFLFTGAWKWGESKWIRIFQVLQLYKQKVDSTFSKEEAEMYNYQYQEAVMARKSRHKMTGFMIALFAVFSYSFLGLTWVAFWCFLINWTLFWIGDMLLNVFIKQKALYRGTTAVMDKIPFWVRFVLILVFIAGLVFLSGCNRPKTEDISNEGILLESKLQTEFIFLFRVPASDPEGERLEFKIVSQPVRGMFSINSFGDMYISKRMLDNIQSWYGQKLEVVVSASDGVNETKATMTFIVVKSPDGKHFLKRDIA